MATEDCFKGFVVGGLIGAALGILYAPKSGKETREGIQHSAEELLERAKEQFDEAARKIEQLAHWEKELYAEKKGKVKKALEAGAEVLNQT
ncbi:YtxH domain-containing protein [bacterium]|nr:MAG: YtxH domain-containing protein [bacterium]